MFDAGNLAEVGEAGGQDVFQASESGEEGFGERLHVLLGDGVNEQELQEGDVRARGGVAGEELLPDSGPVAFMCRFFAHKNTPLGV